jgi:hypothetical protein
VDDGSVVLTQSNGVAQRGAGQLDGQLFVDHHRDRCPPPFGSVEPFSSSVERRWIASSVSSSLILRFAASSSVVATRKARFFASVDPILPAPHVDRLLADLEIPRYISNRAARCNELEHALAKLCW